jgi:AcrR family transcriptional regulator
MPLCTQASPRERIIQAALTLLEAGGVEAVSTRAVSATAAVQPPTIYRHFGDMQGLLNEVASVGFSAYLESKLKREKLNDPVEELREGWNLHLEFGLTHPHLYKLMYGVLTDNSQSRAALEGFGMLQNLLQRVAEAGRLAISVDRAAVMFHGAALGITLSLLNSQVKDPKLSDLMLEAVLNAILNSESKPANASTQSQAATHAVSLVALLPDLESGFSKAERGLLMEWLHRLM